MITAQMERFADILEELRPVLPLHWEELALDRDKVPLKPNFPIYLAREAMGEMLCVTLRERGTLMGYFLGFIAPGLHYMTCLTLTMDIFYVHPDWRGKGGGKILFSEVERLAKARNIQRWFVGNKEHSKIHAQALFEALGFTKVETYYSKWIGD